MNQFSWSVHIPTERTTIYEFQCAHCLEKVIQSHRGTPPDPFHPGEGWTQYAPGDWACPAHKITIVIDGVATEIK